MLKNILIFGAGIVVGALGLSYAYGYRVGQVELLNAPKSVNNLL